MTLALLLWAMVLTVPSAQAAFRDVKAETIEITPSQVYAEVERIEADLLAIMRYRQVSPVVYHRTLAVELQSRHVWQMTYEVMVKINILRRQENYPTIAVGTLNPTENLHPKMVFDQTQRILTELNLIKVRLNLVTVSPTPPAKHYTGKRANDVYLLLNKVSTNLDALIGYGFTPSDVFAQVMRVNGDIDAILHALNIYDDAFPPAKKHNSQPIDAMHAAVRLLHTINQLQRKLSLPVSDVSTLMDMSHIQPADVFEMMGLITSELQPIKYALSLYHVRTPFSRYYQGKTPSDVEQLIGWCDNRLQQALSVQQ